jgi:hypothetical protein
MSRRFIGAEIGVVQNLKIEKLVLGLAFVFGLGNWLRERGFFLFLLRILGVLGGLWSSGERWSRILCGELRLTPTLQQTEGRSFGCPGGVVYVHGAGGDYIF